jgi:hypothetical protein
MGSGGFENRDWSTDTDLHWIDDKAILGEHHAWRPSTVASQSPERLNFELTSARIDKDGRAPGAGLYHRDFN